MNTLRKPLLFSECTPVTLSATELVNFGGSKDAYPAELALSGNVTVFVMSSKVTDTVENLPMPEGENLSVIFQ